MNAPFERGPALHEDVAELERCAPPVSLQGDKDREWIASARASITRAVEVAATISADAVKVANGFGLESASLTFNRCSEMAELAGFVGSPNAPEPTWLNPVVQAALNEAETVLRVLVEDFRNRQAQLRECFTDAVLDLDLVALRVRLRESSGLRKLGST